MSCWWWKKTAKRHCVPQLQIHLHKRTATANSYRRIESSFIRKQNTTQHRPSSSSECKFLFFLNFLFVCYKNHFFFISFLSSYIFTSFLKVLHKFVSIVSILVEMMRKKWMKKKCVFEGKKNKHRDHFWWFCEAWCFSFNVNEILSSEIRAKTEIILSIEINLRVNSRNETLKKYTYNSDICKKKIVFGDCLILLFLFSFSFLVPRQRNPLLLLLEISVTAEYHLKHETNQQQKTTEKKKNCKLLKIFVSEWDVHDKWWCVKWTEVKENINRYEDREVMKSV